MTARHNLGVYEHKAGNMHKCMKHHMIAVGFGNARSLKIIQLASRDGIYATRSDYEKALRAYQRYSEEVRSDASDMAAAFRENNKYLIEYDP